MREANECNDDTFPKHQIVYRFITRGLFWTPGIVVACDCVSPSVRMCVYHELVRTISHHPFKLGLPNLGHNCPYCFGGDWQWPPRSNLTSKSKFTPFWACPHHDSLPIEVMMTKFGPEVQNSLDKFPIVLGEFLVSSLREMHNHHITTRESWVPRLLHRPKCFMVSILCAYLYTLTVSRSRLFKSQHVAQILI